MNGKPLSQSPSTQLNVTGTTPYSKKNFLLIFKDSVVATEICLKPLCF